MLRIATARYVRGGGVDDPQGIELCEEAFRLLDPAAVPLRALAIASLAHRRSLQGIPGFTDDVEAANELLADIESSAPKVAAAVRNWIVGATLGLPGAAHRLRLCDEALGVAPDAEDPWWAQLATGFDIAALLHVFRGHSLMALGRRGDFETNLAQVMELGETSGYVAALEIAHAQTALLALLDGRFQDVPTNAKRMLEAAPASETTRLSYFSLLGAVAIEEGRGAELVPMWEAALAISPDLPVLHATLGRSRFESGDHTGAAEALDHLASRWTGSARNWTWPITLAESAELVAGLEATEHAHVIADELAPYAGELVVVGSGILCLGAFDRYRGMLLGLLGCHGEAVAALTAALALEESVKSPPFTARTRYWLARALLQRDGRGDRERASAELDRSIEAAERLGMAGLALAGRELAETGD